MSHFKAKMHQIRFLASARLFVRSSLRWSLTQRASHILAAAAALCVTMGGHSDLTTAQAHTHGLWTMRLCSHTQSESAV